MLGYGTVRVLVSTLVLLLSGTIVFRALTTWPLGTSGSSGRSISGPYSPMVKPDGPVTFSPGNLARLRLVVVIFPFMPASLDDMLEPNVLVFCGDFAVRYKTKLLNAMITHY